MDTARGGTVRIKLHRPWTPKGDELLRELAGLTTLRAAAKLKRTSKSVEARAIFLGIELRRPRGSSNILEQDRSHRRSALKLSAAPSVLKARKANLTIIRP